MGDVEDELGGTTNPETMEGAFTSSLNADDFRGFLVLLCFVLFSCRRVAELVRHGCSAFRHEHDDRQRPRFESEPRDGSLF